MVQLSLWYCAIFLRLLDIVSNESTAAETIFLMMSSLAEMYLLRPMTDPLDSLYIALSNAIDIYAENKQCMLYIHCYTVHETSLHCSMHINFISMPISCIRRST